ncbi:MAG: arylamine N-acetyltransferase [Candidatus Kapabacteria bacterium]|nr:arylamine N-acetyltransferase [Candidatus Kapabacteria bacterium]
MRHYLDILDVNVSKNNLSTLSELIKAHLSKIPFENISKLYLYKNNNLTNIPCFGLYLRNIDDYNFGGTCYSNNYYFYLLLFFLGYNVKFCSADMSKPNVHCAITVDFSGTEYLIDVGYAAPFIEPIPLSLFQKYEITFGKFKYIINPKDSNNCTKVEMYWNDNLTHGYLLNSKSRNILDFNNVIKNSFNENSTFLNTILLTKYVSGKYIRINGLEYSQSNFENTLTVTLTNAEELADVIEEYFRIPKNICFGIFKYIDLNNNILY